MITEFRVKNFKNFADELVFDLTKTKNYTFSESCVNNSVVKNALIYGINGCGKSNLGFAIFDIVFNLTDFQINQTVYTDYKNLMHDENPVEFTYKFKFDDDTVVYKYSKENLKDIVSEKLTINDKLIIDSNKSNFHISLKGAENLKPFSYANKISAIKYVYYNTILDETDIEVQVFNSFFKFIQNILYLGVSEARFYPDFKFKKGSNNIVEYIAKDYVDEFNQMLRKAKIADQVEMYDDGINPITLVTKSDNNKIDFIRNASTGTISLMVFFFWLQQIKDTEPSFIFMDEFDAFYHYELSELIIEEIKKLPHQVILTTHNTMLLNNHIMRPDCFFLLNNNKIKSFSSLTEKELRFAHNIGKMYRAGFFDYE